MAQAQVDWAVSASHSLSQPNFDRTPTTSEIAANKATLIPLWRQTSLDGSFDKIVKTIIAMLHQLSTIGDVDDGLDNEDGSLVMHTIAELEDRLLTEIKQLQTQQQLQVIELALSRDLSAEVSAEGIQLARIAITSLKSKLPPSDTGSSGTDLRRTRLWR